MAIYLDANVLWSWRTFTETDRLALSIVARQLNQEVFVPSIAAREAEENYRRSLEDALAGVARAHVKVERLFDTRVDLDLEPWPDVEETVRTWRRRLGELATILPLHDDDAHAALDREITGKPPAQPREPQKRGRGGRDAAIWLTIARHHLAGSEEGHLVSADQDLSDSRGGLHPGLVADLRAGSYEIRLHSSIETFLGRLGTSVRGREIELDELTDHARSVVEQGLKASLEVPRAVWHDLQPEFRYSTRISASQPVELLEQRRYEQADDAIVVVNARWEMTADCCYQERETAEPELWTVVPDIEVAGEVQVFLEERRGQVRHAQLIGAQMSSELHLFFTADGSLVVMGPLLDDD